MDWRTCEHEWGEKKRGFFVGVTSYQYQCKKCGIYSYAGKLYDELPDKSKSVFLYGINHKERRMGKSNMYDWITGTWNPLAGECPHKCIYCSTKSIPWKSVKEKYSGELRLDEKAMKKSLGKGNTWFVCAQNDLFARTVHQALINKIVYRCLEYPDNAYIFQTKNPKRYLTMDALMPDNALFGCTIESNRDYFDISNAPSMFDRIEQGMARLSYRKFITIEPILDFDIKIFAGWIKFINPEFVNIGADSKKHNLPEPSPAKVKALIAEIQNAGIEIREKHNLERLLNQERK